MLERLHFLVAYIGSAAFVAFLAACLTSPQVATFHCEPSSLASDAIGAQRCELAASLSAVAPEAGGISLDNLTLDDVRREPSVAMAAFQ